MVNRDSTLLLINTYIPCCMLCHDRYEVVEPLVVSVLPWAEASCTDAIISNATFFYQRYSPRSLRCPLAAAYLTRGHLQPGLLSCSEFEALLSSLLAFLCKTLLAQSLRTGLRSGTWGKTTLYEVRNSERNHSQHWH